MTHPGCLGHLAAPTTPLPRAQGDFRGQVLLLEDAPGSSRDPGCEACVLPQSQVWQGVCQAEEEEAAKGTGLAGAGGTVAGMHVASSCLHGGRAWSQCDGEVDG